ncbi:MAG TPA: TrmJ/YjtD family RNA methyltransferase [Spirochaetota bacterium]|jgi:tRNA/rRNA methyltransferase|nr:MAG: putative tRNA/rRNA methyltransferase [Spirochaetes bacterium ADurb.Bin133]HNZ26723.1 TrmJ/YjtD family RNA methyltransferase [Spirochaetota bacterium]HPY88025.1 TrmJ/YjtD family RNA methyltransferase [Spirochaetota bacterium]
MVTVVLVEPKGEENIGAVCRVMANFGVKSLALVSPRCQYLSDNVKKYSLKAFSVVEKAKIYGSLESALAESQISIALSRRTGARRRRDLILRELPEYLSGYNRSGVSLVFGREEGGLTNDEANLCSQICSVATSDDFPSLNLSHAVALTLYELNREISKKALFKPAAKEEFNGMIEQIFLTLDNLRFFTNQSPQIIQNFIKKILSRAKLDSQETEVIKNVFKSVKGLSEKR